MVTVHSRLYFNQKRIYAPLWAVAAALAVEKQRSVFTLLVHYQQASMGLVSAFRRRRRRLRLHRARFRNCSWSRSPRPAELYMVRDGTMYFTSLSFYPADLLVAACTTCAGFDNSSGRTATRWSQFFFKLPPVSGLGYESDTRLNSSFPSNENWGSDGQGRKFVSCHRGWKTTLADKTVFFPLEFI